MGNLWCRDVKVAQVRRWSSSKPLTLIVPYYENPKFFVHQVNIWAGYPEALRRDLSVIVVDDGSPEHPAAEAFKSYQGPDLDPATLRLFRITVDVRWNWLAARNIGAYNAMTAWILLTDMDHVLPTPTLDAILHGDHDPAVVYAFARRDHTGQAAAPHSASFLMTRPLFWQIGGYDEALSGYYGTDGEFRRRLAKHARIELLPDVLVRHEYQQDSSTTRYQRKQPEDATVRQLIAKRKPGWQPRTLSYPYHEEALCR